jgi:hypothetical protein
MVQTGLWSGEVKGAERNRKGIEHSIIQRAITHYKTRWAMLKRLQGKCKDSQITFH